MSAQNIFKDLVKIFSIIGDVSYSVYLLNYPIQAIIIVMEFQLFQNYPHTMDSLEVLIYMKIFLLLIKHFLFQ